MVRPSRLVPAGFAVERTEIDEDHVVVSVRAGSKAGVCPSCGACSHRIQSQYWRQAADLPMAGRRVVLRIMVRRFWCDAVLCGQRIFAERFGDGVLAPLSRRTERLEMIVHHLGLAVTWSLTLPMAAQSDGVSTYSPRTVVAQREVQIPSDAQLERMEERAITTNSNLS